MRLERRIQSAQAEKKINLVLGEMKTETRRGLSAFHTNLIFEVVEKDEVSAAQTHTETLTHPNKTKSHIFCPEQQPDV